VRSATDTFNIILGGLFKAGLYENAEQLMTKFPHPPDATTHTIFLSGLRAKIATPSDSKEIDYESHSHDLISRILSSSPTLDTKLLTSMLRLPKRGLPAHLFARIESILSGHGYDVIALNALLESRWKSGSSSDSGSFAAAIGAKLATEGLKPDFKAFALMMQQLIQGLGRSEMRAMASKLDCMLLEALNLVDREPKPGNYEFLLWTCVLRSDPAGAIAVYSRMLAANAAPTERAFWQMLRAMREVPLALEFVKSEMARHDIAQTPRITALLSRLENKLR
jgi:hypothetical protein